MAIITRSLLWTALAIAVLPILSCSCPPAPSVTSLSPSSATAGGNQFVLTVNGDDFRRNSLVVWNGSFSVTSFVSDDKLVASISAKDIERPGTVLVYVFNPPSGGTTFVSGGIGVKSTTACGAKSSNAVSFTISP
jgi:trimeric autotransporter adhesin